MASGNLGHRKGIIKRYRWFGYIDGKWETGLEAKTKKSAMGEARMMFETGEGVSVKKKLV